MWHRLPVVCLAVAISLQADGSDRPSITEQAERHFQKGEYAAARALVAASLKEADPTLNLERTGSLLVLLAHACFSLGEFENADRHYRAAIDSLERAGPATALALARAQVDYASLLDLRRLHRDAERRRQAGLRILEQHLDPGAPEILSARSELAAGYHARKQYAEAESLCLELIAAFEQQRASNAVAYGKLFDTLGYVYIETHRPAEAMAAFQRSATLIGDALGPGHPVLLDSWLGKAIAHTALKEFAQAASTLLHAESVVRSHPGTSDRMLIRILGLRSQVLRASGRKAEAKSLEQAVRSLSRQRGSPDYTVSWAELQSLRK